MALTEEGIIHVPGMASRWVRLANGAWVHYMTSGDTGPAVILLHGGAAGSSATAGWRFMAPFLGANGFRVFCPDQPAFGLSDAREAYWPSQGIIGHMEFVRDFADALCLDRFHLSGNSMGCINTAHFVVTYPERVISTAPIAGTVGDLVDPSRRVSPPGGPINANTFDGTHESMRKIMAIIINDPSRITDDLLEMRVQAANRHRESYQVYWDSLQPQMDGTASPEERQKLTTKDRLDKLNIPAIMLYGLHDALIPVENAYMQEEALPNWQFFYPDAGHQGQTDQPEMFNQVFLEFFRDGKVSRKTADWAGVSTHRAENLDLVEQVETVKV